MSATTRSAAQTANDGPGMKKEALMSKIRAVPVVGYAEDWRSRTERELAILLAQRYGEDPNEVVSVNGGLKARRWQAEYLETAREMLVIADARFLF
jgi:hypothetical protein